MAIGTLTSSQTIASGTSVAGTKPSGLAVGDLIVALYTQGSDTATATSPASWTLAKSATENSGARKYKMNSYSKLADSADVAASTFTFTSSVSNTQVLALIRVPSAKFQVIYASSTGSDPGVNITAATTATLTPELANSLVILYQANESGSSVTTYAIATSSPTFTNLYDIQYDSGNLLNYSVGYALRTASTATGTATVTINSGARSIAQMLIISPNADLTSSNIDTTTITDGIITIIKGLFSVIVDSITTTDSITSIAARVWNNISKNVTTWINKSKNI